MPFTLLGPVHLGGLARVHTVGMSLPLASFWAQEGRLSVPTAPGSTLPPACECRWLKAEAPVVDSAPNTAAFTNKDWLPPAQGSAARSQ